MRRGKDRWRHFGRRNNVIIRWTKFQNRQLRPLRRNRLTRNMGKSLGRQFYTHISDQYSPFYTCIISRVRDSTHVLDGLLYHESDTEIREHYTDTAGFTDHVFALMHLLGFAFCPRIRDLHDKNCLSKESREIPGASVTDINDQPESERDRNPLA